MKLRTRLAESFLSASLMLPAYPAFSEQTVGEYIESDAFPPAWSYQRRLDYSLSESLQTGNIGGRASDFIQSGADISENAIETAINGSSSPETLQMLIDHGASLEKKGIGSYLYDAAYNGRGDIFDLLIRNGTPEAPATSTDDFGEETISHAAAYSGNPEMFEKAIQYTGYIEDYPGLDATLLLTSFGSMTAAFEESRYAGENAPLDPTVVIDSIIVLTQNGYDLARKPMVESRGGLQPGQSAAEVLRDKIEEQELPDNPALQEILTYLDAAENGTLDRLLAGKEQHRAFERKIDQINAALGTDWASGPVVCEQNDGGQLVFNDAYALQHRIKSLSDLPALASEFGSYSGGTQMHGCLTDGGKPTAIIPGDEFRRIEPDSLEQALKTVRHYMP